MVKIFVIFVFSLQIDNWVCWIINSRFISIPKNNYKIDQINEINCLVQIGRFRYWICNLSINKKSLEKNKPNNYYHLLNFIGILKPICSRKPIFNCFKLSFAIFKFINFIIFATLNVCYNNCILKQVSFWSICFQIFGWRLNLQNIKLRILCRQIILIFIFTALINLDFLIFPIFIENLFESWFKGWFVYFYGSFISTLFL